MSMELFLVDTHGIVGKHVGTEALLAGIQAANMELIGLDDIAAHDVGIFLTEGLSGPEAKAVGYVACKNTHFESQGSEGALIGGLYLLERYRGRRLGGLLTREITTRVFSQYPDVEVCYANCNELSGWAFQSVGYWPTRVLPSGKIQYSLERREWQSLAWHSNVTGQL